MWALRFQRVHDSIGVACVKVNKGDRQSMDFKDGRICVDSSGQSFCHVLENFEVEGVGCRDNVGEDKVERAQRE